MLTIYVLCMKFVLWVSLSNTCWFSPLSVKVMRVCVFVCVLSLALETRFHCQQSYFVLYRAELVCLTVCFVKHVWESLQVAC